MQLLPHKNSSEIIIKQKYPYNLTCMNFVNLWKTKNIYFLWKLTYFWPSTNSTFTQTRDVLKKLNKDIVQVIHVNQALESKCWEKTRFRSMMNRFHLSFYSHLNVDQCTQSTSNTVNKSSNVLWCNSEEQTSLVLVWAWSTSVLLLTLFDKLNMYVALRKFKSE